ncbi:hypothetical protein SS50377_22495 [Spironucleus salmonicida]|uniref:Uncharacterized protein n=1 Tax=Spironucleus salmonicida TaxID=348837 RepID=A0A9P8RZI9_9EUKA|nr:hypothetical protein SS50377_22495 [Spironucleus salmonicida]
MQKTIRKQKRPILFQRRILSTVYEASEEEEFHTSLPSLPPLFQFKPTHAEKVSLFNHQISQPIPPTFSFQRKSRLQIHRFSENDDFISQLKQFKQSHQPNNNCQ